ncbi:MAG: MoxR family ATPase [Halobacteria archaeon]|nr:MoxR family ATPase [Halobacteria archaeon]
MSMEEVNELTTRIVDNIENVIVGRRSQVEHVLTTLLARGHLLIEDVPGVGKTMLARSLARSIDCTFKRIQFTPDLRPSDVTGANVFNQKTREFEFRSGPVFANIVLGDEINRAPPKAQSALLEAMEEKQVTVDGKTYHVPRPFMVIATQNTIEHIGTYDLPAAQIDRFMKNLTMGYPSRDEESVVLDRVRGEHPIEKLEPVTTLDEVRNARGFTSQIHIEESIRDYITDIAQYTREHAKLGISPRGSVALLQASQARAVLNGRDYVLPDDVKAEALPVLSHRVMPESKSTIRKEAGEKLIEEALENVPVE